MIRKSLSLGTRAAITMVILCFIGAGSFVLWAMEKPRSLPVLGHYIERSLNSISANYRVQIGDTFLLWDQEQRRLDIRAVAVELLTADGQVVGTVPEISMRFSALNLLNGSFIPSSMTIRSPVIKLHTSSQQLSQEELRKLYMRLWQKIASVAERSNGVLFKELLLRDAKLIIDTPDNCVLWAIKQASITAGLHNGTPELALKADLDMAGESASLSLGAAFSQEGKAHLSISADDFPLHKALVFFAPSPVVMPLLDSDNMYMLLTANGTMQLSSEGVLNRADIRIKDLHGRLFHPAYMERLIEPRHFQGKFVYTTEDDDTHASLSMAGQFQENISGNFVLSCQPPFARPECRLNAEVEKFPVDALAAFWPTHLAIPARTWVTKKISHGMVTKAVGSFLFKPEYFAEHNFPKEAINATLHLQDARVEYLPGLPVIEHINGLVKFDGHTIDITADKGATMLETVLEKAHVAVPYISIEGKAITVDIEGKGNAADLLVFFPVERLAQKGINLAKLTGRADSQLKLTIPYTHHPITFHDIELGLNAALQNIAVPALLPGINASEGQLNATIKDHRLTLGGKLNINGNPSRFTTGVSLKEADHFAFESEINTVLLPKDMALAGKVDIPRIDEGIVDARLRIATKPEGMMLSGILNPTEADISWDKFGIHKKKGEPSQFSFNALLDTRGAIDIPAFSYTAPAVKVQGSSALSKDYTLQALELNPLISDHTNIVLYYKPQPKAGHIIAISGTSLDLRNIDFHQLFKQSSKENSLAATVSLKRIFMKNGEILTDVKGSIACINSICQKAEITSTIGENNYFKFLITPRNNQRILSLASDNAAAVARAFNISRNIEGGVLAVNAVSNISENIFYGNMHINDFVTINNPLLSQIIAVISLPGIGLVNLLRGEGIAFDKLDVPFTFANGVITVYNAKATGSVLNILSSGNINMTEATLNLHGTVAPTVYGINSLISKIPVLGKRLMGGKSQGIIAANYRVQGPVSDASVTVNPLSILTPGFLRDLFGR